MKKYIYLLALSVMAATATAQNIQTVKLSFTQALYPKNPLPSNIRNYSVNITTPYLKDDSSFRKIAEDKYQADLKNYPNVIKEAQKNFDEVMMVQYNDDVKAAKEKYKEESAAFDKMTLVERLALADKKPTLQLPAKPVFQQPPAPQVESINTGDVIIFSPETLAKSYIKPEGFTEGPGGMDITIVFKGFEYQEPVAEIVDVENYNPQTHEKFTTKQTQFVTRYRHPATLEVKAGGKVVTSGVFQNTAELQAKTSGSKPAKLQIERQIIGETLEQMNNYINGQYGYPKVYRAVTVYYVKNKKGEYDDVEKAKDFAESGYKNYEKNPQEAVKDLENAIGIWEKVMTEANYDDSKARVDEKVAIAMLKNLIFATILTNDFSKADKYMADYKKLRLSYDEKQFLESQEKMYADMKSRFKG